MDVIVPSETRLKEESVKASIGPVKDAIIELAKLKHELKEKEKLVKEQLKAIAQTMEDVDLDELTLDEVNIKLTKSHSYDRLTSLKDIKKKYPQLLTVYPDIIKKVNVKPFVKLSIN